MATTLAWAGDPSAAGYARDVVRRLDDPAGRPARPRRAVLARLDLGLALTASGELDEAGDVTLTAITSGLLVPSNSWRAGEVITAIEARGAVATADLREAYRDHCGPGRRTELGPGRKK